MSDRYHTWKNRADKHDLNHNTDRRNGIKDISCNICNSLDDIIIGKKFKRFWKWYKIEVSEVQSYSKKLRKYSMNF